MKNLNKILMLKIILMTIFLSNSVIAKDKAVVDIIENLQVTYTELTKENLSSKVGTWMSQVEPYLFSQCKVKKSCVVKYMVDTSFELGTDYLIVPKLVEDGSVLLNDYRSIAFSLGVSASLGVRAEVKAPVFFKSTNHENLVAFSSYLKMTDFSELNVSLLRLKSEFLALLGDIAELAENPEKSPLVLTGDELPVSVSGYEIVGSDTEADNKVYIGKNTGGFTEESPYIWVENVNGKNIVYQVSNTLEIHVNLDDRKDFIDSKRLSVKWEGQQRSLNFPFVEVPTLRGLYYLFKANIDGAGSQYFLRKVATNLEFTGQAIALTSVEPQAYIYSIPNVKEEVRKVAEDYNLIPSINTIYSIEHSAEDFLPLINDSLGRVKKLITPNIEGLPEEAVFFHIRRLKLLESIEVPFFIAKNYKEVRDFRLWANYNAASPSLRDAREKLKSQNIDVIALDAIDLNQTEVPNKKITRFYRSTTSGFPFEALRILRNNPDTKQLMFVAKISNAEKMNTDVKKSFTASLTCNANTAGSVRANLKKVRSVRLRLDNKIVLKDGFIHLPVDISSLADCDTLDEETLTLSTGLSVPMGSDISYESFDWYIQKK